MIRVLQGIDVVDVARLEEVCRRHPAFLEEVFGREERAYCLAQARPFVHLAGRFAAKEATLKALGLGLLTGGVTGGLGSVRVVRRPSGRPVLELAGFVAGQAMRRGVRQRTVSISHTCGVAVASVVLLAETREEA